MWSFIMQFSKSLMNATLFTAAGLLSIASANAAEAESGTVTSSFGVSMDVESICTVKSQPSDVNFGQIQAGKATTAIKGSTTLTLNCSKGDDAKISLKTASNPDGIDGTGTMLGGDGNAEKVGYKLTTDAAGETAWGTGDNAFTTAVATNYETDIATTIYLTVTDAADVTPGNYKDTVNISVAY